jgi:hypothetical protein
VGSSGAGSNTWRGYAREDSSLQGVLFPEGMTAATVQPRAQALVIGRAPGRAITVQLDGGGIGYPILPHRI